MIPEMVDSCIGCQQCMAVCPVGAVRIDGHEPAESLPLRRDKLPSPEQMNLLIRGRRSVRHYRPEGIAPEQISTLLNTVANAPRGVNYPDLHFYVLETPEAVERLRQRVIDALREAAADDAIPERMAMMQQAVDLYDGQGFDLIFRGAPHLLVVSEPLDAPTPTEDVNLALAYFELLAQSSGLGTVWCGMLKMAMELIPALKQELGIPEDHFYFCMLFGTPAVRFQRTVQRDDRVTVHRY